MASPLRSRRPPPRPFLWLPRWRCLYIFLLFVLHCSEPGGRSKAAYAGDGVATTALPTGTSWGWPSQARHKRPRSTPIATLVFSPVFFSFLNRQSRVCSHMFALQFSLFYRESNPRRFTYKKKKTSLTRRASYRCFNLKENGKKRQFYGPHARQEVASTIDCH